MNIRIGAFGSKETIEQLKTYEEKWPTIQIIPFTYKEPEESKTLVEQAYGCDVYFFTGPVPYLYAKDVLDSVDIPSVVVPFDQLMISNAFNLLHVTYGRDIERLSIDTTYTTHVEEILHVLEIESDTIHMYNFAEQTSFEIQEIVDYHLALWNKGKIDIVLTSIIAVEEKLKEHGVRCLKMPIPQKNVEFALQEAETLGRLHVSQTAEIVVGFVKVKNIEKLRDEVDEFQIEKILLSLHQILLRCTHEMDLSLYRGSNQFVIFGTKGSLEQLVAGDTLLSYIREIETTLHVFIVMGFGSGSTATQAEANAKRAMQRAGQDDVSSCYLLSGIGQFVYLLTETTSGPQRELLINRFMQDGGITVESASTFVDFLIVRNFQSFSTQDYAAYSNVTTRTAARFIKKMVDSGIIELAGEQKLFEKGRPRTMYQFKGE